MSQRKRMVFLLIIVALFGSPFSTLEAQPSDVQLLSSVQGFQSAWPEECNEFTRPLVQQLEERSQKVQQQAMQTAEAVWQDLPERLLRRIEEMVVARQHLEKVLARAFEQRLAFQALESSEQQKQKVQAYLQATDELIDLSGRMHEFCLETIRAGTIRLARMPEERAQLIRLLVRLESSSAANTLSWLLIDPPPSSGIQPLRESNKAAILRLIAQTHQTAALPALTEFLARQSASPELVLQAVETVLEVGLPQVPAAAQASDLPEPELLAEDLLLVLDELSDQELSFSQRRKLRTLQTQLREQQAVSAEGYRVGQMRLKPGDWLLIRNPSPYNLFSTLSPGLFTHIGILTTQTGEDGKQRLVVVEMRERGSEIPASNIEAYLKRTLHYVVLRHRDPKVCRQMAATAAEMIGNPSQFDLTFQIERVNALKGKPLAGRKIDTYCAGFLWLCAQPTDLPRETFFPLVERPYNQQTVENLHRLGMQVGEELITPTGALFSGQMELIGRREALYSPSKDIEQAIFDAFGEAMLQQEVIPSPSWYQALRLDLAEAAQANPLLAQAMASAADVHEETDLVSAAKAAAIVESLDEIAFGKSREFRQTWEALMAGPENVLAQSGRSEEQIAEVLDRRAEHAELWEAFRTRQISPFRLRAKLVRLFTTQGRKEVLQRFFLHASADSDAAKRPTK